MPKPPAPKHIKWLLNLTVEPWMKEAAQRRAAAEDRSVAQWVRIALRKVLEDEKKPPLPGDDSEGKTRKAGAGNALRDK